jgi:biotin carboxyl carrier protein
MDKSAWRNKKMKYIARIDGLDFPVEILDDAHVKLGEQVLNVNFATVSGQPLYSLIVDGKSYEAYVYPEEHAWQVLLLGRSFSVTVEDEREKKLLNTYKKTSRTTDEFVLTAPLPGLVITIPIAEGQKVEKGQTLIVLESMKMQNELKSPRDGKISRLMVKTGESVEQKQYLLSVDT